MTGQLATLEDVCVQDEVAELLAAAWRCDVHGFRDPYSPLDYWLERDGKLCGFAELKARSHSIERFPTVYLASRKWLALELAGERHDVAAVFVCKFTDRLCWIRATDVDAARHTIVARVREPAGANDREPVIEIPTSALNTIADRRARAMSEMRECPVDGCEERHPRSLMMCRDHWFAVPKPLRDEVWESYRHEGVLSERYGEARDAAIAAATA
jgi:hypothetical protein